MKRRDLLAAVPALAVAALPSWTAAQPAYPGSPVKVLVGFPPGTATDVAVRAVSEQMARRLSQPFIVDNKPGAGSNIAAKAVATAQPDGYTVFAITIASVSRITAQLPPSWRLVPSRPVRHSQPLSTRCPARQVSDASILRWRGRS